jgi:hypothetical protein
VYVKLSFFRQHTTIVLYKHVSIIQFYVDRKKNLNFIIVILQQDAGI